MIAPISLTLFIQQVSPGQSPEHWGTKSFFLLSVLVWRFLIRGVRANLGLRVAVYLSEAASAVGLSLVVSYFDVFKKATYVPTANYQPDWHVVFWASVLAALVAYYLVVKLTAIVTKESEESKSKELTSELEKTRVAVASLSRQRSLLVKIGSFAPNMVSKKILRLCALLSSSAISIKEFVEHLNPELQVQSNMKLIHEFFKSPDGINVSLRLALWMKGGTGDTQSDKMAIAYSFRDNYSNEELQPELVRSL